MNETSKTSTKAGEHSVSRKGKMLTKRLAENTSTRRVLFNLSPLSLSFIFFFFSVCVYEHIDSGASIPSGVFMTRSWEREGEKKTRRKIDRPSFARYLVREVVKHEADSEINFTNPSCEKPEERKSPADCSPENLVEYEVS